MSVNSYCVKLVGLVFVLLAPFVLSAQEDTFLNGLVLDETDRSPVVFATVRIKNQALGVITNSDGSFRLPDRFRELGDSIIISSLGYKTKAVIISDWKIEKTEMILLEPEIEVLDEVVVSAKRERLNAREIVARALQSISKNYPTFPHSYIGYYRDYQFANEEYVNLNEAIVQFYDQGFDQGDYETTETRILELKRNMSFPRDSAASAPYNYQSGSKTIPKAFIENYSGNELIILRIHDAIRNHKIPTYSFVNKLSEDFLKNHKFFRKGLLPYNDDFVYKISFRKWGPDTSVQGEIYISATDFGILKMDYRVFLVEKVGSRKKDHYYFNQRLNENPLYSILVEYDKKERYYLNYLSFQNHFEVTPPPEFVPKSLTIDKRKRVFIMEFSTPANEREATRIGNYNLSYYGQKIKIESITLGADGREVVLKPKKSLQQDRTIAMIEEDDYENGNFEIKFGKIKDVHGNQINKSVPAGVEQFREFFVQQIVQSPDSLINDQLMVKNQPLFAGQPIIQDNSIEKYWMNTPLKK